MNWLLKLLQEEFRPHKVLFKMFRAGSAYEKLQAGEASDFDVMVYMNIWRGKWKVRINVFKLLCFCKFQLYGISFCTYNIASSHPTKSTVMSAHKLRLVDLIPEYPRSQIVIHLS